MTIEIPFSDPKAEVLGSALENNTVCTYDKEEYWVVKADYINKRRRTGAEDVIAFKVIPNAFCHALYQDLR